MNAAPRDAGIRQALPDHRLLRRGLTLLWWLAVGALMLLNAALLLKWVIPAGLWSSPPFDWGTFQTAVSRIGTGTAYAWELRGSYGYSYRYSPLFLYVMVPFVAIGLTAWRALHFAALLYLPWRIALIVALSWPFWEDVLNANVMTFAFVLGFLAWRGSRAATGGYLGLTLLVPRPLMLPLAVWLVWRRPEWRIPAAAIGLAAVGLTLATGEAWEYLGAVARSGDMILFPRNYGPTHWFGLVWLGVGIPLAAILVWRDRVGWASLAVSPYLLPYHFLMGFLELAPRPGQPQAKPIQPSAIDLTGRLIRRLAPAVQRQLGPERR